MIPLSLLSILLILFTTTANSQQRLLDVKTKLLTADSVIIVSHETTAGVIYVDEKTGREIAPPKLIIKGQLNNVIIHERVLLQDTALHRFATIITRPFQDTEIEKGMCFEPHHAVVFYKRGKPSFIDICFGCMGIETSSDLKITANDFDFRKWAELIAFFKQKGLKYELDNTGN